VGKILISKDLDVEIAAEASQNGTNALPARRHGLDDDCAIEIEGQGWTSQVRVVEKERRGGAEVCGTLGCDDLAKRNLGWASPVQ
jgi:hypothetical protein